ncbi:MAG TPA: amino acid-binding protein, partial [Methanosarcinales archaeon]|nr:amino acid-binding protein [Methanosarcinales archaeon]
MRVSMDLELKDIPGQLILAIQPISEFKGNIVSVIHHREKKTPRGTVPVQIVFEIDSANLEKLNKKLKENGIIIARVGEERLIEKGSVVLIG